MMELMVEVVIIAFVFGGIIGAIVAMHLSTKLKQTNESRESGPATIELPRNNEESAELKPIPVDLDSHHTTADIRRRR